MNFPLPADLGAPAVTGWALAFMLVLSRISAAVMVMPALGEQSLPMIVRAGVALGLTVVVFPLVHAVLVLPRMEGLNVTAAAAMIATELFAGILIGWIARMIAMALPIAGQMIALFIGLSSVLQPDAELGAQTTVPARFMNLLAPVLLLMTGAYLLPIRAIIGSYQLIPAGTGLLTHIVGTPGGPPQGLLLGDAARAVISITARSFALGLELSAPFLILFVVWELMLGVMTRLLPSLQIYFTAIPLQLLGGIALLALTLRAMIETWQGHVLDAFRALPGL